MNSFKRDTKDTFLILGSGVAGLSAAIAIRERNKGARIVMMGDEPSLPYSRPMLTKTPLRDFRAGRYLIYGGEWYEQNRIEIHTGRLVTSLDAETKTVSTEDGETMHYDKCVYALGAECIVPTVSGSGKNGVAVIRRIEDMERIRRMALKAQRAIIIGGGVIGIETAWELKKARLDITVLELAETLMERVLDEETSKALESAVRLTGIHVETGVQITGIGGEERADGVTLADGTYYPADFIVMSCGIRPNVQLAREAGIKTGRSVIVNELMETSASDVYACGDCAEFNGVNTGTWTQAEYQGRVAGANAAGDSAVYGEKSCPIVVNAAGTSLFAVGDMGKSADKQYETQVLKNSVKESRFMVNEHKSGGNCYEKYYFSGGRLTGAALIGDLSKMQAIKEAVAQRRLARDFMQEMEDNVE